MKDRWAIRTRGKTAYLLEHGKAVGRLTLRTAQAVVDRLNRGQGREESVAWTYQNLTIEERGDPAWIMVMIAGQMSYQHSQGISPEEVVELRNYLSEILRKAGVE